MSGTRILVGDVREKIPELPQARYRVVYADCPWRFKSYSAKGEGRSASNHSPVMRLRDIADLGAGIQAACHRDCHLFLWVPGANLPQALEVMEAWGFRYSSVAFTWVKVKRRACQVLWTQASFVIGMGHTTRKGTEICLLGRRGSPKRLSKAVREVIFAPIGPHSEKPVEAYERIEAYSDGPYLELFARKSRPGWDAIGNELDSDPTPIRVAKIEVEREGEGRAAAE